MIPSPEIREAKAKLAKFRKEQRKARPKVVPSGSGQRQPRVRDPGYLQWIRRLPCVAGVIAGGCEGPIQACHVRYSDARHGRVNPGLQSKPSDRLTYPGCEKHHILDQHTGAERAFWNRLQIDPGDLCKQLSDCYDNSADGAAIIMGYARCATF